MLMNTKNIKYRLIAAAVTAAILWSCTGLDIDFNLQPATGNTEQPADRLANKDFRKVFIVYMMGFNNLSQYLAEDTEDLINSKLMSNPRDALIIFSHRARVSSGSLMYSEPTSPIVTQIYKSEEGKVVRDTLWVMPDTYRSSDASTMNEVLTFIKERFDADSYGMLMSSHGTGWMPENYCNNPEKFDNSNNSNIWGVRQRHIATPKPFLENLAVDSLPAVKSIGVQNISKSEVTEMDITDIASAIPMKMEFIIFDACFMGGVEVAYQFKDICDKVVFSQTEIMADGMDYKTMCSYIFTGIRSDLEGFCQNYYEFYNRRSGSSQSATISLIDCIELDQLAEACKEIFESNRSGIKALEGSSKVQKYYRDSYARYHKWFFDLYDIADKSGATAQQLTRLREALDRCVIYKATTNRFIDRHIEIHSGFSMYLPYKNLDYLNGFYKTLEWNKATGLVQ